MRDPSRRQEQGHTNSASCKRERKRGGEERKKKGKRSKDGDKIRATTGQGALGRRGLCRLMGAGSDSDPLRAGLERDAPLLKPDVSQEVRGEIFGHFTLCYTSTSSDEHKDVIVYLFKDTSKRL